MASFLLSVEFSAVGSQRALTAFGISGGAAIPAEEDDAVAEIAAFFRRQNGTQLLLHFFRLLSLGKPKALADANAVGIADHTARNTVKITQKQIGGLSAYTGEL